MNSYPIRKRAVYRALKTGNKGIFVLCSYADLESLKKKYHFKTVIYPDKMIRAGMVYVLWKIRMLQL